MGPSKLAQCDFCLSMSRSGGPTDGDGPSGERRGVVWGAWGSGPGGAVRRSRPAGGRRPRTRNPGPVGTAVGRRGGGRRADRDDAGGAHRHRGEIRRLLGPTRPVAYEDTVSYFKIHLAERYTWVMCQLSLGRKRPSVCVPWPQEQVQAPTPFGRRQFRLTNGAGRPFDPAGSPRSAKGRSNVPVRHRDRPSPGRRPDRVKSEAHRRERTRTARPCTLRPGTATTQAVGPVRSGDRRGRAGP